MSVASRPHSTVRLTLAASTLLALPAGVLLGPAAGTATARQQAAVRLVPAQPAQPAQTVQIQLVPAGEDPGLEGAVFDVAEEPGAATAAAAAAAGMDPAERDRIVALYEALEPTEQEAMAAEYAAVGIDLLALVRGGAGGAAGDAATGEPPAMPLLPMVQQRDFRRTPQTVLAARTALGLGRTERPAEDADAETLAAWLHTQVMAGEWAEYAWFLAERAGADAGPIHAHVLQSTNQGDPLLLPEEVLALADAAPAAPEPWQLDVVAQLLATAAGGTSTAPLLERIEAGTRYFGRGDDARRRRTADLLVRAGLVIEAFDYLPSLEAARMAPGPDAAEVILGHAAYQAGVADGGRGRGARGRGGRGARGPEAEQARRQAFALYGEVALMDAAGEAARRRGLDAALDMLPDMPEQLATPWLDEVFRREALAPAALEKIALGALTLADANLEESQRTRTILIMKTAVQTLLGSERVDRRSLRVPLRMLTTALVTEAEKMVEARPDPRRGDMLAREKAMMLRAIPDATWLETIEDSLAIRAWRAFVGLAAVADETDLALDLLEQAVARHPQQAAMLADDFLARWSGRLRPEADSDRDAAMMMAWMMFGGQSSVPDAPLTRGRQARNLGRLDRVLGIVGSIGVDPRTLSNVVGAFRACHSQAEAFTAADIERVLGPIDELPGPTAATLAEAMRSGLAGDWRNRQVQQRFGLRRNASEIAEVVADGYAVAIALIDRAIAEEPESWSHAVTRAALAFDRLEHRKSTQGEDFPEYESLRQASFDAFADAASRYAAAAAGGGIPTSIDVHAAWFNAAVGATQLSQLTRDSILAEGPRRDEQLQRIREQLEAMPASQAEEHVGLFVQRIVGELGGVSPEVKPQLVRHALAVVGEHPLAAPLRRIAAVHEDLISNEIALRLVLDGSDRVGTGRPFGAVLSLRYTNAVDRETDGFSKYLRNQVWTFIGNAGRSIDYRDRLEASIERSLSEGFQVEAISFFDPLFPSREVRERGQGGWQEKPLAYVVISAVDPSVERVPPIRMDLDFIDSTGPIVLAVGSNAPVVDAAAGVGAGAGAGAGANAAGSPDPRPVRDLAVEVLLDTRGMDDAESGRAVTLEVRASGRGVVPELEELLAGLDGALAGYALAEDGIESHPMTPLSQGDARDDPFGFGFGGGGGGPEDEDAEPLGPDEDGMFRTDFERAWTVRYEPDPAGGAVGDRFRMPVLREGVQAELVAKRFDDLDIVTAEGPEVPVRPGGALSGRTLVLLGAAAVGLAVAVGVGLRRLRAAAGAAGVSGRRGAGGAEDLLPSRETPLAAIAALQRIQQRHGERLGATQAAELAAEIRGLEQRYFGPGAGGEGAAAAGATANGDVAGVVRKWARVAGG